MRGEDGEVSGWARGQDDTIAVVEGITGAGASVRNAGDDRESDGLEVDRDVATTTKSVVRGCEVVQASRRRARLEDDIIRVRCAVVEENGVGSCRGVETGDGQASLQVGGPESRSKLLEMAETAVAWARLLQRSPEKRLE